MLKFCCTVTSANICWVMIFCISPLLCMWLIIIIITPKIVFWIACFWSTRPTQSQAGRDHCFRACCLYVRPSPLYKSRKQNNRKQCSLLAWLWVLPSGSLMTPLLFLLLFWRRVQSFIIIRNQFLWIEVLIYLSNKIRPWSHLRQCCSNVLFRNNMKEKKRYCSHLRWSYWNFLDKR